MSVVKTRSKTSTFGLTYCQIEILQIRKKQNIKNKRTAHLQHSTVQFSTSTFAVHYSTIQYQHICSTFQVTCTFAAHKDGDTRSYFIPLIGLFAVFRTITAQLQHICCTNTAHLQHQYISAQLQHNYSTFQHNYSK